MYIRPPTVERLISMFTVVFGVMIAVAWDATIVTSLIQGDTSKPILGLIIYSIVITVVSVVVIVALGRINPGEPI
jgi:hypothetical protein